VIAGLRARAQFDTHMSDDAERDPAELQREFEHSLIAAIQEASPDGILVVDGAGLIVSHNRRLFDVFGLDPRDFPGGGDGQLTSKDDDILLSRVLELVADREPFLARVRALYADPALVDLCEIALKDGRTLERHSTALWNAQHRNLGRVWFFRDITERKRTERALEVLARQDVLTGVPNRRAFLELADAEFARARRYARPMSLVAIDIDHFKHVNDRFGHAAGDAVLKDLCACATATLRQQDIFARLGGEEFAILVPETDGTGAQVVAERLRHAVSQRAVGHDGHEMRYTFSAGVATMDSADATIEATLRRADAALYDAKRSGRDRTVTAVTPPAA
jgi:diguanylate cyclase (GGDEF)-like protein